jgi:hypothetical protein
VPSASMGAGSVQPVPFPGSRGLADPEGARGMQSTVFPAAPSKTESGLTGHG